uniref:Nuclear autoantigenic sperm protein n=1 Tax=Neolamprologus brichardi TaxID=32507 RepID=A0A3Q4GG61_NEOBR
MEEANKLIGTGKKHLVMGKVVEAVSTLQEASGMLAKEFGDTADECGEAFFWYGKALLDLARMENSVLGNALEGVPEEEEEEEEKPKDSNVESIDNVDEKTRDELRVQVYDAMAEKKTEDGEKVEGKQSGDPQEKTEGAEAGDKKEKTEKEDEEEGGDDVEMEGEPEDDDEEVGNLQLAWEMLEVAKVIYKRKETKEDQLMAAQAHLKLGEVSAESGNYPQALEDFQECLKLQVKHLDSDSRLLAETHYQLGLTYSLNTQYSEAIESLKSSISIIKNRLDKLQEMLDKAEGPEALPEERKELEELKALLPEIQEKVEDATESLKTASAAVKDALVSLAWTSFDCCHVLQRKPEESPVKEDVKKVKQDNSQPGEKLLTNGDAGEHANDMEVER